MSGSKTMVYLHNGILCSREKEGAPTLCNSMDGTGDHYAKWNKPGGKGQIPYVLTFKWNLINKTNKQAKYNQRHWNWEQADSDQRGEGRRWGGLGWWRWVRRKGRKLYLKNNKNKANFKLSTSTGTCQCMAWLKCASQNSYVETLTTNVMVFGDGAFGGWLGLEMLMTVEPS